MSLLGKIFEKGADDLDDVVVPRKFNAGDARQYAERAAAQFMNEYGNLLSCYTLQGEFGLWATLQTYLVTMGLGDSVTKSVEEGDVDGYISGIFTAQVNAFSALFLKGALERLMVVEALPDLAAEELTKLLTYARVKGTAAPAAVPQPVALTPTEICAQDWKDLGSGAFQKKYISNQAGKKVYEQALAEGKIS